MAMRRVDIIETALGGKVAGTPRFYPFVFCSARYPAPQVMTSYPTHDGEYFKMGAMQPSEFGFPVQFAFPDTNSGRASFAGIQEMQTEHETEIQKKAA